MITVQQIVYTSQPQGWWALAQALGLVAAFPPDLGWSEFDGGGVLAVHPACQGHPAGSADLHLLVDDLDAAEHALEDRDVTRAELAGVGEMLTVRTAGGATITVSAGAREARRGDVAVQPILFQSDVDEARAILEALGLRAGISADGGDWVELHASGGGSVGVHRGGTASVGPSFLASDLDALVARLAAAGFAASVIDEAYGKSLHIPDPDGGTEVWVNVQDDLYGYHREG